MMLLTIAFRNILRNVRRSVTTMLAIAVGAVAMLAFGGFMAYMMTGFKTSVVEAVGHLSVMRSGFFEFGSGNPAAYGIADYKAVEQAIAEDPVLKPMINVISPTINLYGLAANFDKDSSRTFIGVGIVPSDRLKMRVWDEPGIMHGRKLEDLGLDDADEQKGVIGVGLARILGLCKPLKLKDCPTEPAKPATAPIADAAPSADLAELAGRDVQPKEAAAEAGMPRIDLLAATAGGAPNVVSLFVSRTRAQGAKELDDGFVSMHLNLAQQLLYGRGEKKVTSLVIQLHHSDDMDAARSRLNALFKEKNLALEVHDFKELTPMYNQVIGMFGAIFVFIAVVMAVIVLFTVGNTMSMSVMERTNEIGTTRALGVRRLGIRKQFVAEGLMLGAFGATLGLVLAEIVGWLVNSSGFFWTPPGQANPIPLKLLMSGITPLMAGVWLILVIIAVLAALVPASRAARMPVVDALRHV
jgi:putative ABC transport system permease protein